MTPNHIVLPSTRSIFPRAFLSIFILFLSMIACNTPAPESNLKSKVVQSERNSWRVLGPGGGGAMFLPTVNPADPQNVFLRCDMTGAYVTHDGGESWRMFHLRAVVRDFEFDPSHPDVIYASNTGLYR